MKRLTAAQSAMLFDQIADPGNVGNNVVASMMVTSSASTSMHRRAWLDALRRHPVLTSRITAHDSGFQFDSEDDLVSIDVDTVADVTARTVREELGGLVLRPFDLFAGPLVRAAVRTDGRRSVVALVVHHVLIDVASAPMILNEYFAHLRVLEHDEPGTLVNPGADFEQFVDSELRYLGSQDADRDRDYWRDALAGYRRGPLDGLPVSLDTGPDPLEAYVRFETDPSATDAVRSYARDRSASPASVFLALYLRALAEVSDDGGTDIALGLPVLRRDETHLTTLGSFTQLAAVRADVSGELDDVVDRAHAALAGAKVHGRLPIGEISKFAENPSALTETTFLYEPSHLGFGTAFVLGDRWELDMSGYTGVPYPVPSQTGQFDLRFQVGSVNRRFVCAVHFGPRRRRAATLVAERIRAELHSIAGSGTEFVEPGRAGSGWTHPAQGRVENAADDVLARIASVVDTSPRSPAVSSGDHTVDYGRLWSSAAELAATLTEHTGTLIAIVMPKDSAAVSAILGTMMSDKVFVVIDPSYPTERRRIMLEGVDGVIVHSSTAAAIPESFRGFVLQHSVHSGADASTPPILRSQLAAYAVYTSGSTGRPKRVLVGRDALARSTAARDTVYSAAPERFLHLSSLSFDSAYAGLFWTLATGGELVLVDMGRPRSTAELADEIRRRSITHVLAIPSLYDALLDEPNELQSLRQVIVAGEECTDALVRRHHSALPTVTLTNEYGPSESAVWSTADHTEARGLVTIGRPVEGIAARVVDDVGRPVAPGISGELLVSGTLAFGYDGDARSTASKFRPDPGARNGERVYATGDLVRYAADGRLLFDGRVDDQLKISGFRIEPREVEMLVRRITGVTVVAGATSGPGGRRELVVAVPRVDYDELDAEKFQAAIRAEVPAHLVPRAVVPIETIPRNVNGKIDRRALDEVLGQSMVIEPPSEADTVIGASGVLEDAVRTALSVPVDPRRSFLELGGDSIAAMRVVGYLHRRGVQLSPRELLTPRPLAELAAIASIRVEPNPVVAEQDPTTSRPTSRAQRAMLLQTAQSPESGVYVEQLVLDLAGDIDVPQLVSAWRTVFRVFPVLGAFAAEAPFAVLDTGRVDAVPVAVRTDCGDWTDEDWDSELAADRTRGFVPSDDTLSRVSIAPNGDGVRMVWTHHHAVADGWSLPIVIGTLAAAYRDSPTPEPQCSVLRSVDETVVAHDTVAPPLLDRLPTPRSDEAAPASRTITLPVDADVIAERLGVTVAALINTVWSLVLGSSFGVRTVEHGMVSSGRDIGIPGMDTAVGMFVRIDPIAVSWDGSTTLAQLGTLVAQHVSAAIDGPTAAGWTPETLVVVENYPLDPAVLSFGHDVQTTSVDLLEQTEFPLVLQYRRWPDSVCHLHVDRRRVSASVAAALADRVHEVLTALATADPDSGVDSLSLRPPAGAVEQTTPATPLLQTIAGHAVNRPERLALVHGDVRLSYAELDSLRGTLAHGLSSSGVGPGHVVAVHAPSDAVIAPTLLAVASVAAAWIVVDHDVPQHRADEMLARSGAHWTLVPGEAPVRTFVPLPPAGRRSAGDLAYLIYTSGTTGEPKCIAVSHDSFVDHLHGICARFDYRPSDSVLVFGSVAFDASLEQLFGALYVGAAAVVRPRDTVDPVRLTEWIDDHAITIVNPPTGYWTQLASHTLPSSVRTVIVGGEALPAWATKVAGGVTLWNAYGPTEGVVTALAHRIDESSEQVPVGTPQSGRGVRLLGADGFDVDDGIIGEIWLTGILAVGYLGDARATADAFRPDPTGGSGERMYRTADLGVRGRAGAITFAGRVDRQTKIRGYRVDPTEIESAAVSLTGVSSARALLVTPSDAAAARLECVVVGDVSDAHAVRSALADILPPHLMPARVHIAAELPLTRTGKVDDAALRVSIGGPDAAAGDPGDGADVDAIVTAALHDVLGPVERTIGFVTAGGDSLRALELCSVARRSGVVLDMRVALANGTAEDLIASATVDPSSAANGTQPERSRLLPPAVHWFRDRVSTTAVARWNMAVRLDLDGMPDSGAVDTAVREVLRVHPMLRARLDDRSDVREFVLTDTAPLVFFFDTGAAEMDTACKRVFNTLSGRVGIDNGTPIGFGVVRVMDTGEATVIVVAHHLVMDVVSLQIVAGDLLDAIGHVADPNFTLPPERTSVHEWVQWLTSEARADGAAALCRTAYRGVGPNTAETRPPRIDPGREGEACSVQRVVSADVVQRATVALGARVEEVLQSAAVTAFSDTTGRDTVIVEVETHGRELESDAVDLTRSVGWFTGLSTVPVHAADSGMQIAEIRGRRAYLGTSGQLLGSLRYLVGVEPVDTGLLPDVGVNYVGRLDETRSGSLRAYGGGRLRAAGTQRPVPVQIDAWFRGDGFVVSVEHVDEMSADRVADGVVAALESAACATPVPVESGLCSVDLRGHTLGDVQAAARGGVDAVAPLTEVQEAMFLRSESDGDDAAYIEQIVLELPPGVDVERLRAAVESVVLRMPLLRGTVLWEGLADPILVVSKTADGIEVVQETAPESEVAALTSGSTLFRASISPRDLVLTFHHLVADGWTTRMLLQHIDDHYAGKPVPTRPDRRMLEYMVADAGRERVSTLDRAPAVLLPMLEHDAAGKPDTASRNVDIGRVIEPHVGRSVRRAAARQGVTLAAVAHAAWASVLGSGEQRVRFGSIGQRRPAGHAEAPGMYIEARTFDIGPSGEFEPESVPAAVHRALQRDDSEPADEALVRVGSGAMYSSAVIVDDARGTGSATEFLGRPVTVLSTRERTGLAVTASVIDLGPSGGIEVTLNCDTAHVSERDGHRILDRYTATICSVADPRTSTAQSVAEPAPRSNR